MSNTEPTTNGRVTIREVYQLLEQMEQRQDRRFQHLEDKMDVRFIAHEQHHKSIREEAISRFRWTIGLAIGLATLIATVAALIR